jgi:hypothetical protein
MLAMVCSERSMRGLLHRLTWYLDFYMNIMDIFLSFIFINTKILYLSTKECTFEFFKTIKNFALER